MKRLFLPFFIFSTIFFCFQLGFTFSNPKKNIYKEDEVLVKFKPQVNKEIQSVSEPEKTIKRKLEASNIHILKVEKIGKKIGPIWLIKFDKKKHSVEAVINKLKKREDIEYVEPNYIRKINRVPNDYNPSFWWIDKIGLSQAWDIAIGSDEVVVAVVDSGIDYTHEDLQENLWKNPGEIPGNGIDDDGNGYVDDVYGINAILDNGDPMDDDGHGTHVAGIIGAVGNNGIGVVGVNWRGKILACKFLGVNGEGYLSDELKCYDYLLQMKNKGINIRVVNMSFSGESSFLEYNALKSLSDNGIILVSAAGNEGINNDVEPSYPCNYDLDNIICVAASDYSDNLADFSNYGNNSVHLAAPGYEINSTYAMNLDYISKNIHLAETYFFDNFENGGQNWIYKDPSGINHEFYVSPYSSLAFVRDGFYDNNQIIEIISRSFNLTGLNEFPKKVFVSSYYYPLMSDFADSVKLFFGRGEFWKTIVETNGFELSEIGYDEWHFGALYVPFYFREYDFRIKLRLETDGSEVDRGVFFDDFAIYVFSEPTRIYEALSGTSMATPFVTGACALALSINPNLSAGDIKRLLLNTVDVLPQLSEKVKTSGRLNIAKLLSAVLSSLPCTPPFSDVPCDYWAYDAIKWAKDSGVSTGWPDGTFRPEEPVKRDAMAAFIIRAIERTDEPVCNGNIPCQDTEPYFSDVDQSQPFFSHIQRLYELGITKGWPDGTYRPYNNITRDAMAAFLVRAILGTDEFDYPQEPYFQDVPPNHPFFRHIQKLRELGYTKGCNPPESTLYCPDRAVTRAEMAVFLCRIYGNCPK